MYKKIKYDINVLIYKKFKNFKKMLVNFQLNGIIIVDNKKGMIKNGRIKKSSDINKWR